ncbi:sigma-70 family RNA polymerase sigma factor [Aeoliella sp.]|uniref:sigma-70 family RNA polymerase sigma factor n=1 Tax=Aeoliella sp. TaxID=2795800 RepID=UPI003CCBA1A2
MTNDDIEGALAGLAPTAPQIDRDATTHQRMHRELVELVDAVASLPAELRDLVVLKTWGGLTFDEMAEVLRVPSSTLHRKYREALDRLRKLWEVPCPGTTKSE